MSAHARHSREHCLLTKRPIREGELIFEIRVGRASVDETTREVDLPNARRHALVFPVRMLDALGLASYEIEERVKALEEIMR